MSGSSFSYIPFILLSHQRSGSSMLTQILRKHSGIRMFGELFMDHRIGFNVDGFRHLNHSQKMVKARNKNPERFLAKRIYPASADCSAIGFKVFPLQLEKFPRAERWLRERKEIKVLALKRWNSLKTFASLKMARQTDNFGIKDPSERSQETVHIDPEICKAYFERHEARWAYYLSRFQDHARYCFYYEDLVGSYEEHMRSIFSFLDLEPENIEVPTVKKEVRPLNAIIENYEEVARALRGTRWEHFLDEAPEPER